MEPKGVGMKFTSFAKSKYRTEGFKRLFKKMEFDTEKFILEIKKRPAIWNSNSLEYADKDLKLQSWMELVEEYAGDEELSREERKQLRIHLQKKWRNVRDCFVKTHRAKTKTNKKVDYVYYNSLMFLTEATSGNNVMNTINVSDIKKETVIQSDDDDPLANRVLKRKKPRVETIEVEVSDLWNKKEKPKEQEDRTENDEDRLFFLSMVKEFRKIPEHMKIQAKIDLLQVIKDAQLSD